MTTTDQRKVFVKIKQCGYKHGMNHLFTEIFGNNNSETNKTPILKPNSWA